MIHTWLNLKIITEANVESNLCIKAYKTTVALWLFSESINLPNIFFINLLVFKISEKKENAKFTKD